MLHITLPSMETPRADSPSPPPYGDFTPEDKFQIPGESLAATVAREDEEWEEEFTRSMAAQSRAWQAADSTAQLPTRDKEPSGPSRALQLAAKPGPGLPLINSFTEYPLQARPHPPQSTSITAYPLASQQHKKPRGSNPPPPPRHGRRLFIPSFLWSS